MKRKFVKFFNKEQNKVSNYEHLATIEKPTGPISESYRRIKVALEYSEVDRVLKVLQICSSIQGEGKTTTLLNLAVTHSENGKKILAFDLDFRRPTLHRAFKVENKDGIVDVLAGKISLDDAIKKSDKLPFDLLNRGSRPPYPSSILGSKELETLFEQLKEKYDYILVDCPPILAVSDAVVISRLTDGVIFIVSQNDTEKQAAKNAIKELKNNNVNVLGCVVTGITSKQNGYGDRYHYYYRNYYTDK